jgi:hypothetical protein
LKWFLSDSHTFALRLTLPFESMAGMGVIARATDKLPTWAQIVLMVGAIGASVYCIAHYGFWSFFLHMIFSPNL